MESTSQLAESLMSGGSVSRSRTSATFFSQQQLETLQAELEHERSLRLLDQKRAQQVHQRLEKQVGLAIEEADESKALLDTVQSQSENLTAQLRQARDDALEELRSLQIEVESTEGHNPDTMERMWQERCRFLEEQVQAQAKNEGTMHEEIEGLRAEMEAKLEQQNERNQKEKARTLSLASPLSAQAPPAILKELNHVRIQLAKSERQQRQFQRKTQEFQSHNKDLIKEREEYRLAAHRLPSVEQQLEDLSKENATVAAENASWKEFARSLAHQLKGHGDITFGTSGDPPAVNSIIRILERARSRVERAEERANQAEALAGKGSFNPDMTQVLHFHETPLIEALKEEIEVLKRQVESVKGEKATKSAVAVDPDKLNQRLKENFKEQISLFREGVYLMTGYKVDMLPGTDRPTFRVRSVFAEQEEDHLLLK